MLFGADDQIRTGFDGLEDRGTTYIPHLQKNQIFSGYICIHAEDIYHFILYKQNHIKLVPRVSGSNRQTTSQNFKFCRFSNLRNQTI